MLHQGADAAPFTWPGGMMEVEALARARDNGADVVLTGVGADEILDGEPRALASLRKPWRSIRAAQKLRGFERPFVPAIAWVARPILARLQPRFVRAWRAGRSRRALPVWAGPLLEELVRRRDPAPPDDSGWERPYHEHLAWLRHQEDVAAGIACVPPFLDPSLRSLILSFDPAWLLHGGVRRGLFREAVRDVLPTSLVARMDKAAFEVAFQRFLAAAGGFEMLRPLASVRELASAGLVEPKGFMEAFDVFERAPQVGEYWTDCWPVLATEAFLRERGRVG